MAIPSQQLTQISVRRPGGVVAGAPRHAEQRRREARGHGAVGGPRRAAAAAEEEPGAVGDTVAGAGERRPGLADAAVA